MLKHKLLFLPVLLLLPHLAEAQQMMAMDASTSMLVQEFNALLSLQDDEIKVQLIMGNNPPLEGENLERGDVILMINGNRATDIETFRTAYEEIPDDEEIKIGVQRGEERFILTAIKGDVEESPGAMTMTIENEDGGPLPVIVPEIGAVIADMEDRIEILRAIPPIQPDEVKEVAVEKAIITAINGEKVNNAEEVRSILSEIEVGDDVSVTFEKDGEENTISFKKPEPRGTLQVGGGN